jgi:LacI family transcriptional regulator
VQKVTLKDIADRAGVHISTVSRALDPSSAYRVNAQTVNEIRRLADEMGYRPDVIARGYRKGTTATFGVVVPDLGNPGWAPILRGIENTLESRGLMAIITETQDDDQRLSRVIEHLMSRRVDALIVTAARDDHVSILEAAADRIPVVLAVRSPARTKLPHVVFDDVAGGRLVGEHLLSLGHTRIGQLPGPTDVSHFVDRSEGFKSAVHLGGGVVLEATDTARRPTIAEGARIMQMLLEESTELPTAVFAHNDLMAFGAIGALRDAGLDCPEDFHVVGYDDTPMAAFSKPSLTSVRHPSYEIGRIAADFASMMLDNPDSEPAPLKFPPSLSPRASTGHEEVEGDQTEASV